MRRAPLGALAAVILLAAMPAAAAKVTIQAGAGSDRDLTVVLRAGHDSVVISGPLASIPPEAWAKMSPEQIEELAQTSLVHNPEKGGRPLRDRGLLGAGKKLVAVFVALVAIFVALGVALVAVFVGLGVPLVVLLVVFGVPLAFVVGVVYLVVRCCSRR